MEVAAAAAEGRAVATGGWLETIESDMQVRQRSGDVLRLGLHLAVCQLDRFGMAAGSAGAHGIGVHAFIQGSLLCCASSGPCCAAPRPP